MNTLAIFLGALLLLLAFEMSAAANQKRKLTKPTKPIKQPTARPTRKAPPAPPAPTHRPTPTEPPTPSPTPRGTPAPSTRVSQLLGNTDDALENTETVQQEVAFNDDSYLHGNSDFCSLIDYTYTDAGDSCTTLELQLGCFGSVDCQMTLSVDFLPVNVFPFTTELLRFTEFATTNVESVVQEACPGDDDVQVAENDDSAGPDSCSVIHYTYLGTNCETVVLQLGGGALGGSSQMTASVDVTTTTDAPTEAPTSSHTPV
ncbi:hypothetical protein B484DRAFT_392475 [Ochromonadaceae sp. CCMP2298]|nr:hypothetical protein B484DRAFT_392475 [Ochromonadaceae sp. CCMP2298]